MREGQEGPLRGAAHRLPGLAKVSGLPVARGPVGEQPVAVGVQRAAVGSAGEPAAVPLVVDERPDHGVVVGVGNTGVQKAYEGVPGRQRHPPVAAVRGVHEGLVVIGGVAGAGVQPPAAVEVAALLEIDELVREEESPRDIDPFLRDAGRVPVALRDLTGPERLAGGVRSMLQEVEVVLPHEEARVVDRIGRQGGGRAERYD